MDKWLAELGYDPLTVAKLPFSVRQKSVASLISHIAHLRSVQKPERIAAFDKLNSRASVEVARQFSVEEVDEPTVSPVAADQQEYETREQNKKERPLGREKIDRRGLKNDEEKPTQAVVSNPERRVAPPARDSESTPALPETPVRCPPVVSHGRRRRCRDWRCNSKTSLLPVEAQQLLAKYPAAQFFGADGKTCQEGFIPRRRAFLDLYSGAAGVARSLSKRYRVWVLSFDYEHSPDEDLLEPAVYGRGWMFLRSWDGA